LDEYILRKNGSEHLLKAVLDAKGTVISQTPRKSRRSDIVALDKEERKLTIINVAVPSDANIKETKQKTHEISRSEYRATQLPCGSSTWCNTLWD
jgi:hypothetical protein